MESSLIPVLAPKGKLRVAINLGNSVLAQKETRTGTLKGVSVRLSEMFAQELGIDRELIEYQAAGRVVDAASRDEWDLAFLAIDPLRAETLCFSKPYVIIEGAYLVSNESPLETCEDVDRKGIQIAVGKNAAYDLYLSRTLQHAGLVRASTTPGAVDLFFKEHLDVVAGIKGALEQLARENVNVRMLRGSFMQIKQAMVIPRRAAAAMSSIDDFMNRVLAGSFIKEELIKSDQDPSVAVSL